MQRGRILCSGEVNWYGSVVWDLHTSKEKDKSRKSQQTCCQDGHTTAVSPPCSPDLAGLLLNSDVIISGWPWCTWCMDWWQYPQLILLPADSLTRANHSFKCRTISCNSTPYKYSFFPRTIPSWNLLPAETAEAIRPSMHSSIVFRSSAFHLHRRDIPSGSLPITFQIQIQRLPAAVCDSKA